MKVYMDNSATTPVFPEAIQEMVECLENGFGNPSSLHVFGREAYNRLDIARERVAKLINANKEEIYFTSGGTEADNLALQGTASRYETGHIITSSIEHPAINDTCEHLEKKGFRVTYLPVDSTGRVNPEDVKNAIQPDTILISVMHANNEVGTVQPIAEIGKIANRAGVPFHVDAVQSLGKVEVDVEKLGVDMLTMSSHKINGPKGAGALYVRKGTKLNRIIFGGGQERKLRSGTENMPGIVGFGKAAEITMNTWQEHAQHTRELANYLMGRLEKEIPDVTINGSREHRLPHNVHASFAYIEGEALLLYLDMAGIAVSSGSACSSGSLSPSHVLKAMGLPVELMHSAIRMTLGKDNTKEEMDYVVDVYKEKVDVLRKASPFTVQK